MPEEMRFLLRAAGYGLGIGIVYYVLSQEPAGTILLIGFGLAASMLLIVAWWERRRAGRRLEGPVWRWLLLPPAAQNGGFSDESGRLPGASLAPLTVALGMALAALALVFGPWLLAAAVIPLGVGLRGWLREAMAEHAALEMEASSRAGAPSADDTDQAGGPAVVNRR